MTFEMETNSALQSQPNHPPGDLAVLVDWLEWGDHPYQPEDPRAFRRALVRRAFRSFRARLDPVLDGPRFERMARAFERGSLEPVLQKTGVAEVLLGYAPGQEELVFQALEREASFFQKPSSDQDVWDAGQTLRLRQGEVVSMSTPLCGGIPFCDDGPVLRQGLSRDKILGTPFTAFTAAEKMKVVWRVDRALELISAVPSPTRSYVPLCVDRIFARKFGAENQVHSNSRTGRIGWIFLGNPHLEECSVGKVIEMILHEGLHHDLALREYKTPFLAEDCPTAERLVPSPWTGNPVAERNLSHAILVWFGLACFFERFGQHPEIAGFTKERLPFYRAGFHQGRLSRHFESPDFVHPSYLALLERIEERAIGWR